MSGVQSSAKAPKGKVQQNVVLSPDVSGGDVVSLKESKTQLLRYLNNEVERTAKGLKEEVEAREKIERWIKESYRPTLAKIREQLVDEMAEVREREGEEGEMVGEKGRGELEGREKRREREEKFSLSHSHTHNSKGSSIHRIRATVCARTRAVDQNESRHQVRARRGADRRAHRRLRRRRAARRQRARQSSVAQL